MQNTFLNEFRYIKRPVTKFRVTICHAHKHIAHAAGPLETQSDVRNFVRMYVKFLYGVGMFLNDFRRIK